ncbi:MAG: ABC transporter substrate-binding protein [Erysipelotrichaceae bacterium]|nr:ABC transporter substrate-binding protein [Erysipelotrichaceae bacterium]
MRKFVKICIVLMMCLLTLCACSGDKKTDGGEDASLKDFEVILDWYPNSFHSFLYVAQEKGYFAEEGLNVTITAPAGYSDALTFPAAGKAEAGLYYMDDVTVAYCDQGMDIKILGTATQESLNVMCALKESGIESPADFKGKTIGYTGSTFLKAKILTILKDQGLTEDDITLVDIGFDSITALTTGSVDVVAGSMVNSEIIQLEDAGYEVNYWTWDKYGAPREYNTVFVVNKTDYEADQEKYDAFVRACQKGFDFVKDNPEAAMDIIMNNEDAVNYELDREVEAKGLQMLIDIENASGVKFMTMKADVWNDMIAWAHENGLVENVKDAKEFVVCE